MKATEDFIKERLSRQDAIDLIETLRGQGGKLRRRLLARELCKSFGFQDEAGEWETKRCVRVLRVLETNGTITLETKIERLWEPVPPAVGVPERVDQIADLRLELVETEEDRRLWNELMVREHPLKLGWRTGRIVRYLVWSEHGVLGGVGFGPAAWKLAERDRWIGWNEWQRREHLQRVLGMNRFLIRPGVDCRNLASRVLSLAVGRVREDFERLYDYQPWVLETFVDRSKYRGTCYEAANWNCIGETSGRGRQDREKLAEKGAKAIYLYELEAGFRARMGLERDAGEGALRIREEADLVDWARKEFGTADLGDKRLTERLVAIAEEKSANPGLSVAQSTESNWAKTFGYYRFVEHADTDAINMESILAPHRERTIRRMMSCDTVICIQDSTDLDFSSNRYCQGLGVIGKNQTRTESRGLRLHSTLAINTAGIPLGILGARCYAPKLRGAGRKKDSRYIPIEEKETYRWIQGQEQIAATAKELPGVRVISTTDREGDFYEHFESWERSSGIELLIRAKHDRLIEDDRKIFETVEQTPLLGIMRISISRRSQRPKQGKRPIRRQRNRRDAIVEVRSMPVLIAPPQQGLNSGKPPIPVWLVHIREKNPPANAEDPVNWYLLSTMELESFELASQATRWYCLRWRIEDWHRVLKSAMRVEDSRLECAERLKRDIAINMVIAWRIMLMSLLGRAVPELPAEVLFTDLEIEALGCYAKKKGIEAPANLGEAIALISRMGGHLDRRGDSPPGHLTLARGYRLLMAICEGISMAQYRDRNRQ